MAALGIARFGAYELNLGTGELRKSGVRVRLQDQPFQVLSALLENPGELVTREELQKRLWPDAVEGDFEQGLNKAVNKLRTALSDRAENPRFIETLARRGYRFVSPVQFDGQSSVEPPQRRERPGRTERSAEAPPPPPRVSTYPPKLLINNSIRGEGAQSGATKKYLDVADSSAADAPVSDWAQAVPVAPVAPPQALPLLPPTMTAGTVPDRSGRRFSWLAAGIAAPIGMLAGLAAVALLVLGWLWIEGELPWQDRPLGGGTGAVLRYDAAEARLVPLEPPISGDGVSFSPNREWVVFVGFPSAQLFVMRQDGRALTALAPGIFAQTYMPEWSSDGDRIAFAGRKPDSPWRAYVIHRDGSGLRELNPGGRPGEPGTAADPSWSPGADMIAMAPFPWDVDPSATGIFLVNLDSGAVSLLGGSRGYFSPQWSPDGRYLAALTAGESRLVLYDFAAKTWTTVTGMGAIHPVWDRRGTAVYFISDGKVQRYRVAGEGRQGVVESVLSIDGMELLSNSPFGERAAPWVGLNAKDEVLLLRPRSN
jgi:DNA-binding winged helix-turn-helix (wHTH) protein